MLSSTASRNITDYSLYRDFCTILFIKKLIKNNKDIGEVIVETKNVKEILKSFIINDKIKISVKKNKDLKFPLNSSMNLSKLRKVILSKK